MRSLPYGKQFIDAQDVKLVVKSLKQKLITSGNYVKNFEKKVSVLLKTDLQIFVTNCLSSEVTNLL